MKDYKLKTILLSISVLYGLLHSALPTSSLRVSISCPASVLLQNGDYCYRIGQVHSTGGVQKWKYRRGLDGSFGYNLWVGPLGLIKAQDYLYHQGTSVMIAERNFTLGNFNNVFQDVAVTDPENSKASAGYIVRVYHRAQTGGDFLGRMHKPVVICQGFDPNYKVKKNGKIQTMNADKMEDMLGRNMIEGLLKQGHSVVLILFKDPTTSIDYNAEAALQVLRWVQEQAVGQDMVVVGPSMGGLVMRKALIEAAKRNIPIHPRLFIAYDSPNWGAIIAPAVQAAAHFNAKDREKQKQLYTNLTSKAASQMLLYQIKGSYTYVDGYFAKNSGEVTQTVASKYLRQLNAPQNWDYLRSLRTQSGQPIRVVAVADGSPNIGQGLTDDDKYCDYDYTTLDWEMKTAKTGTITKIAWFDPANVDERYYKFREPVFTENLPGGVLSSYTDVMLALKTNDYGDGNWGEESPYISIGPITWNSSLKEYEKKNVQEYRGHAFIPTASAAGIQPTSYSSFNSRGTWLLPAGTQSLGSTKTMFDDAYIAGANWNHVSPANEQASSPIHSKIIHLILEGTP